MVLIVARGGAKFCLPLIPLPDTHQVLITAEIQLGENAGLLNVLYGHTHVEVLSECTPPWLAVQLQKGFKFFY